MAAVSKDENGAEGSANGMSPDDLRLTCKPLTLAEATRRILGYESDKEHFTVARPGMPMDTPWPMARDFDAVERPVRVYSIEGHDTKLVVPEAFAVQLDAVRRVRSGEDNAVEGIVPELRHRALPEDFVAPLDSLPSSKPIRRLYLMNEPNPLDPWLRKSTGDPFFTSQATTERDVVTFHEKDLDPYIGDELRHEWAHALRHEMPFDHIWFDMAVAHEGTVYAPRDYALVDNVERHAVLMGEEILSPDPARFLKLTQEAPLQCVLLARELREYLLERVWGDDRPAANDVTTRVAHVERTILPDVVSRLVADVRDEPDGGSRREAERLLVGLDKGHLLNALPNVTCLDLSYLPIGGPRLMWLEENSRIESLDLEKTFVGGYWGLKFLRNMPLRKLSLARTDLKGSSLGDVEAIPTIEDLDLSGSRVAHFSRFGVFRLENLRRLDLSGTALAPEELAWLRRRMSKVEILFEE